MKLSNFLKAALGLCMLVSVACTQEEKIPETDKVPQVTVLECSQSAFMGTDIHFKLDLQDEYYPLSTLKVQLMYGDVEAASKSIKLNKGGIYEDVLNVPFTKGQEDSSAKLVFEAQNSKRGKTVQTASIQITRPCPDKVVLTSVDGQTYDLTKTEGYQYELTGAFPAKLNAFITISIDEQNIQLGWDGDQIAANAENPIPFSATLDGEYTVKVDLFEMTASPFGEIIRIVCDIKPDDEKVGNVLYLRKGVAIDFPNLPDFKNWYIDRDFIEIDESGNYIFNSVDGYYKILCPKGMNYARFYPVDVVEKDGKQVVSWKKLGPDCDGALWIIGANFGKPVITANWNTGWGCHALAQIAPKVFQFTLNVGDQLKPGFDIKFFHQKGWGGEIKGADYAEFNGAGIFAEPDAKGNIKHTGEELIYGKAYRITIDMNGGVNAVKCTVSEVEGPKVDAKDIKINGVQANMLKPNIYKVKALNLKKNETITFSGIDEPAKWYIDPDHFRVDNTGIKFNAVDGFYSIELNTEYNFVTVRRVKESGKPATFKDEGAVYLMGWGIGHPALINPIAWDRGQLYTLAEVEPGKFQFTGKAVNKESISYGGRISVEPGRAKYEDGFSVKLFGQAGWGTEQDHVTFTDAATALTFHQDLTDGGNLVFSNPLENGATYVLTFTFEKKELVNNKFNYIFDCKKL